MCAAGVLAALILGLLNTKRMHLRLENAFVLFVFALSFGLAGAFLTHMFVSYSIGDLVSMLMRGTFFEEYSPGFVYYGGFLFGIAGAYLASRLLRFRMMDYAPCMLPALPMRMRSEESAAFSPGAATALSANGAYTIPKAALLRPTSRFSLFSFWKACFCF